MIELALLVKLGELFGFMPTMLLVIGTGIIGASLARSQGLAVWKHIQVQLTQGQMPTDTMIEGLILLIGGVVLLTPGLISDIFGLLCLIPWTRQWIAHQLSTKFSTMAEQKQSQFIYLSKDDYR